MATSYLLGVSTRRMEKLVETLGITRLSKSQVSEKDLYTPEVTSSRAEHQSRAGTGVCFITGTEIVIDGEQLAVR